MMFNNKFNSDGTIHFDVNEWTNTDPRSRSVLP